MRLALLVLALAVLPACASGDEAAPVPAPPQASTPLSPEASGESASEDSDAITVVFFGDSLTAGYGLANPDETAYPALLDARMEASGVNATVVNAGLSGETSAGGLRRVDWALSNNTPDVFVLALGANDMLRGQPATETEKNLRAIFDEVREIAPEARLVLAGMEALPNLGRQFGETYRQLFRDVAADYDAAFIPFLLDGVAGVRDLNQRDGVHPTARGHEIMAETVWAALEPIVRAEASGARG